MGEGQVEEGGDVDTAENVKVGEVALGNTDDADKRAFNWAIEGFAITEEFQHCSWKMILQKRDDTEIIAQHPHFCFHRFSPLLACLFVSCGPEYSCTVPAGTGTDRYAAT